MYSLFDRRTPRVVMKKVMGYVIHPMLKIEHTNTFINFDI